MAGRVNFDSLLAMHQVDCLLAMHQEAMRIGHGSKPWIEFAIRMADVFPSLYKMANKMNAEAVELVAQRDELLAALGKAEKAAHSVLIAGGDYGDELSDQGLRELLRNSRDIAKAAIAAVKGVSSAGTEDDSVECDRCPNVTAGCLGKCMKAEVA